MILSVWKTIFLGIRIFLPFFLLPYFIGILLFRLLRFGKRNLSLPSFISSILVFLSLPFLFLPWRIYTFFWEGLYIKEPYYPPYVGVFFLFLGGIFLFSLGERRWPLLQKGRAFLWGALLFLWGIFFFSPSLLGEGEKASLCIFFFLLGGIFLLGVFHEIFFLAFLSPSEKIRKRYARGSSAFFRGISGKS